MAVTARRHTGPHGLNENGSATDEARSRKPTRPADMHSSPDATNTAHFEYVLVPSQNFEQAVRSHPGRDVDSDMSVTAPFAEECGRCDLGLDVRDPHLPPSRRTVANRVDLRVLPNLVHASSKDSSGIVRPRNSS
jgi:hypothetical protein